MTEGSRLPGWPIIAAAVGLPLVTCAIFSGLRDQVTPSTVALVLVLWVVAAAATGERVAGVLAALSAGLWFDFFLTEPYQRLAISDPDDIEVVVLLVVIGIAVTEVALWGRRQQARATRYSGYLDGVLTTATTVAHGDVASSALIDLVDEQIVDILGAEACRFVPGAIHDIRLATMDQDGLVTRGDHVVNVDRVGLPTDEEVAILVRQGSQVVGHFVITSASQIAYPSREQCRVAVLLAERVAPALGDQ